MEAQTQTPTEPTGAAPAQSPPPVDDRARELELENIRLQERLKYEEQLRKDQEARLNAQFRPVPEPPKEDPLPEDFDIWAPAQRHAYMEAKINDRVNRAVEDRIGQAAQPLVQQLASKNMRDLEADVVKGLPPAEAEIALNYVRSNITPQSLINGYTPQFVQGIADMAVGIAVKKERAAKAAEPAPAPSPSTTYTPFEAWYAATFKSMEGREPTREELDGANRDTTLVQHYNALRTN
jgi:hypothetical protein